MQAKEIRFRKFEITDHVLHLQVEWDRMYVPLTVEILPQKETSVTPGRKELHLLVLDRIYPVTCYPTEYEAADEMGEILSGLELLGEMESYLHVYEIFQNHPVEGVRFQTALRETLKKKHLSFSEDRLRTVLGYRDYSYMKKKWKVLLRRQKLLSPTWEEVIDMLSSAVLPIWEVSVRDEVFFGDWMPEIGRYLD